MQSKRCSKCGVTKTLAEFWRDRTRIDGLQSTCKECVRAYYEANREERCAYSHAYYEAHRQEICARDRAYREAHQEEIRAYNRSYREEHNAERNAHIRRRKADARKASREVATRNGEPWTPAEDHVAITSEGTMLEIAIELGRTIDSVKNRRALLRRKAVTA